MKHKHKKRKGFTLIELLVVIAIIGVLASIALSSLNKARVRALDTKRVSHVRTIRTALELYYNDRGFYPSVAGSNFAYNCQGNSSRWPILMQELEPYLSPIPISYHDFFCIRYVRYTWGNCPSSSINTDHYTLVFATEEATFNGFENAVPQGQGGSKGYYCAHPF